MFNNSLIRPGFRTINSRSTFALESSVSMQWTKIANDAYSVPGLPSGICLKIYLLLNIFLLTPVFCGKNKTSCHIHLYFIFDNIFFARSQAIYVNVKLKSRKKKCIRKHKNIFFSLYRGQWMRIVLGIKDGNILYYVYDANFQFTWHILLLSLKAFRF